MHKIALLLSAVLLGALALFCVFGFLASFEYAEAARRLPWQIGYGAAFLASLGGIVALLRGAFRQKA